MLYLYVTNFANIKFCLEFFTKIRRQILLFKKLFSILVSLQSLIFTDSSYICKTVKLGIWQQRDFRKYLCS